MMNISEIVVNCLSHFKNLASESDDAFRDEYGRFRTWVGSVAAHRTGEFHRETSDPTISAEHDNTSCLPTKRCAISDISTNASL